MRRDRHTTPPSAAALLRWQRALGLWNAAVFAAWVVVPFALAGALRWPAGWLHLSVVLLGVLGQAVHVGRRNPALRARRRLLGAGTPAWDLAWNLAFWPLMAAIAAAGGLEQGARGPGLGWWASGAGVLAVAGGLLLSTWAMAANPWFEGTVRVQPGQRVCARGPYRIVRHPGYAGLALWALGTPLLLRSRWALAPAVAAVLWLAARTALEDRLLLRRLPGYPDYARATRRRLVPGVW